MPTQKFINLCWTQKKVFILRVVNLIRALIANAIIEGESVRSSTDVQFRGVFLNEKISPRAKDDALKN